MYGSVKTAGDAGQRRIEEAAREVVGAADASAKRLWSLRFTQTGRDEADETADATHGTAGEGDERVLSFPAPRGGICFDDGVLELVRGVWRRVAGDGDDDDDDDDDSDFLAFEEREASMDDAP